MSKAYTADGKRRSSMTHARRGHECSICGRTVFGNGGRVAHGRGHVRRGEAVELVKDYADQSPLRLFLPPGDKRVAGMIAQGFTEVVDARPT